MKQALINMFSGRSLDYILLLLLLVVIGTLAEYRAGIFALI